MVVVVEDTSCSKVMAVIMAKEAFFKHYSIEPKPLKTTTAVTTIIT